MLHSATARQLYTSDPKHDFADGHNTHTPHTRGLLPEYTGYLATIRGQTVHQVGHLCVASVGDVWQEEDSLPVGSAAAGIGQTLQRWKDRNFGYACGKALPALVAESAPG